MRNTAGTYTMVSALGRALAFAGALSLAGALPALAATGDNNLDPGNAGKLCVRLSEQFNNLKPFKEGLPYWQKASTEFTTGKADCAAGKPVDGAKAMQAAISDLYVKPDTL